MDPRFAPIHGSTERLYDPKASGFAVNQQGGPPDGRISSLEWIQLHESAVLRSVESLVRISKTHFLLVKSLGGVSTLPSEQRAALLLANGRITRMAVDMTKQCAFLSGDPDRDVGSINRLLAFCRDTLLEAQENISQL